jgi:hypothetical protein
VKRALQRWYVAFRLRSAENDLAWHTSQMATLPDQIGVDQAFIDAMRTRLAGLQPPPAAAQATALRRAFTLPPLTKPLTNRSPTP